MEKLYKYRNCRLPLLLLISSFIACGSSSGPSLTAAEGVTIQEISIYQSLKRTLVKDGKDVTSKIPLIAERATLIRIFYKTDSTYDKKEVTARLIIKGYDGMDLKATLGSVSSEDNLASTINFYPPKQMIKDPLEYSVELLQERTAEKENAGARHPAKDYDKITVAGKKNTIRVILVPFRYKADGSNRLPDLSAAQVQKFKERFLQLYPVSDAIITVHKAIDWSGTISGMGMGWQEVGLRLMQVRTEDKISDDTYLYGIFNPAASLAAFCGFGCMLGVTLLNNTPPDKGMVTLRLALGVGFKERAVDTATHEIGHAHGRKHANCGPGLDPSSIDGDYPKDAAHQGGKIGVWGFDMIAKEIVKPTRTDIMGYCDNKWISDHNFIGLWNRGKNVNLASWQLPASGSFGYDVITLDAAGHLRWRRPIRRQRPLVSGNAITVILDGRTTVQGELFRFDHMPGGWLFLPQSKASSAEFSLGGRTIRVDRLGQ